MGKTKIILPVLILLSAVRVGAAAAAEPGRISGYMFGDYYYIVADHRADIEDMNGFWFRRIYLAYDKELDDGLSTRLKLEMGSPGDFSTSEKMSPDIKDAYLKWTCGRTQVLFGISATPTWETVEKIWGYRAVEKTPVDLQKFGSSRDFGISVKGKLGRAGKVYYHAMFGNGSSNKSETNKQKKVMGSLGAWLTDNFIVEGYADFDGRPDHQNRATLQGFVAYKTDRARVGFQFMYQHRQMGAGEPSLDMNIWSGFAAAQITGKVAVFGRVDIISDPNPDGAAIAYIPFDETAKATFIVGGLDFHLSSRLHVMPNVELVGYSAVDDGPDPDTDVIPRVTVYYRF